MKLRAAFLIVAMAMSARAAHADTKAWAAAKKVFPAKLGWIAGARFDGPDAHKAMQSAIAFLNAKHPDDAKILPAIKSACGAELPDMIDSIVAGSPDDPDDGALVVALRGIDHAGFDACIKKLAAAEGETITIGTAAGGISTYSDNGDTISIRWLDKDVLVFAFDADRPKKLAAMTAGGLAGDKAMLALVASAKPDATAWAAVGASASGGTDLGGVKIKVTQVYGHADLSAGNVTGEVHVVTTDARANAQAATKQQAEDAKMIADPDVPAPIRALLKVLAIKASGKELVFTATMPFDQLVQAGVELAR